MMFRAGHSEEDVLGTQDDSSSCGLHFGVNPVGMLSIIVWALRTRDQKRRRGMFCVCLFWGCSWDAEGGTTV